MNGPSPNVRKPQRVPVGVLALTCLAMLAFAANSILCRLALQFTAIDAGSFTSIRLISGAALLFLLLSHRTKAIAAYGSWPSASALFVYAGAFSFSYLSLSVGTGALILFGSVQATMVGWGLWCGGRLPPRQSVGFVLAIGGLVGLLLPGLNAPPLGGALLMMLSGIAWGLYSIRGHGAGDPALATAGNFLRAVPFALGLSLVTLPWLHLDAAGVILAIASGAIASGLGYIVWYAALRDLLPVEAAAVQLSVPVLTALAGISLLGEAVSIRMILAAIAILGGIGLVIFARKPA